MNEAATSVSPFDVPPEHRVRLSTRVLVYFSTWILVALAFQILLRPEGPTETDFSPLQQRLLWPLYAPLMVVVGLVQAATGSARFPNWAPWLVVAGFAVHFIIALTRVRRSSFVALIAIQVPFLVIAVIYFVRQSYLPTGG
jgi:hypothetical protein